MKTSKGIKSLQKKVKDGEGIVMPTDKTDGMSFETVESYKLAANVHIKEDETISEKERKHVEAEYIGIAKAMTWFLRVGEGNRPDGRIVEAVTMHNVATSEPVWEGPQGC